MFISLHRRKECRKKPFGQGLLKQMPRACPPGADPQASGKRTQGRIPSATCALHFVTEFTQPGHYLLAVVALDYYVPFLDSAAGAAQLLELLCQRTQFCLASHHPVDHGDGFPAASFAVAHHAHNTITFFARSCGGRLAATAFVGLPAGGAGIDSSCIG